MIVVRKKYYIETLIKELCINTTNISPNSTYIPSTDSFHEIPKSRCKFIELVGLEMCEEDKNLPYLYWTPKLPKIPFKHRKESFNKTTHNMKEMWKELGNLLNASKKKTSNLIRKLIINNKDIANALNEHFTTIGKNLTAKFIPQVNNSFKTYMTDPINNSLFPRLTDTDEIIKKINQHRFIALLLAPVNVPQKICHAYSPKC